jgi:hypothetical protein
MEGTMKVKELIKTLQMLQPDFDVWIDDGKDETPLDYITQEIGPGENRVILG